jgi:hypothetical protein
VTITIDEKRTPEAIPDWLAWRSALRLIGGHTGDRRVCRRGMDLDREHAFHFSGTDDRVHFDIDADGVREWTNWTAYGSGDAFLALDRNGNDTHRRWLGVLRSFESPRSGPAVAPGGGWVAVPGDLERRDARQSEAVLQGVPISGATCERLRAARPVSTRPIRVSSKSARTEATASSAGSRSPGRRPNRRPGPNRATPQ